MFWRPKSRPELFKQNAQNPSPNILVIDGENEGFYMIPGVDYPNLVKVRFDGFFD
jgi:hypothetical protein